MCLGVTVFGAMSVMSDELRVRCDGVTGQPGARQLSVTFTASGAPGHQTPVQAMLYRTRETQYVSKYLVLEFKICSNETGEMWPLYVCTCCVSLALFIVCI